MRRLTIEEQFKLRDFLAEKLSAKDERGFVTYKGNWSDERVAVHFKCTVNNIKNMRQKLFGIQDPAVATRARHKERARDVMLRQQAKECAKANGVASPEAPKGDKDARRKAFWANFNEMKVALKDARGRVDDLHRQTNDNSIQLGDIERRLYRIEREWFGDKKPEPVPSQLDQAIHKKDG